MKTKITLEASFNSFSISLTIDQALSASHAGQCDADVAALVSLPEVQEQLTAIEPDDIRKELSEAGAWDDEELADDAQNQHRIIWQAACQIAEEWKSTDAPIRALCQHLDCAPSDVSEESYEHYGSIPIYSAEGGEYAVGMDEQADSAWDASLDSYIDECIMPEIKDKTLAQYFDTEAWKRDARMDGRGHSLSSYDGEENEQEVDGITYYIYRTN